MATSYTYKPIVSDSLIFHLDAANLKSYNGVSNTWSDLRGSSYNGVIVNSTTFSSVKGGVFSFDGVDDYMSMSAFQLNDGIAKTFNFWIRPTATSGSSFIFSDMGYIGDRGWGIGINLTTRQFYFGGSNNGSDVNKIYRNTTNASLTHSVWTNISIVYNPSSTTASLYKDGVLLNHDSGTIYSTYNNSGQPTMIGAYGASPAPNGDFTGQISIVSVYDRDLTSDEILQNYNALKNRFI